MCRSLGTRQQKTPFAGRQKTFFAFEMPQSVIAPAPAKTKCGSGKGDRVLRGSDDVNGVTASALKKTPSRTQRSPRRRWRRVQDSNPRGHHCPNGFQDRPVMTASVTLQQRKCTTLSAACQSALVNARITSPASQARGKARSGISLGTLGWPGWSMSM